MKNIKNRLAALLGFVLVGMATLAFGINASAKSIDIDVNSYGYGKYVVTARGIGYGGEPAEDYVTFYYLPLTAEVTEDENTKNYTLDLNYNPYEGTEESTGDVANIVINVYDADGNLVKELSPMQVTPPTTSVILPFGDYGLPSGTYKIVISTYDKDGNELYEPYVITIDYEAKSIPVPDTGGMLGNLNISKTDYLITGLIIFSLVGISGAIFIAKRGKATNRRRK